MHRHSLRIIFKIELFEFFWYLLRHVKGTGISSFCGFVQEIYERNGAGNFASEPVFREAFFGYMSTLDINFKKPCPCCPIKRDRETGVLFSACSIIGYDDVSLRSKTGLVRDVSDSAAGAPEVDCYKEHIYDRLFLPGSATKSDIGRLRVKLSLLCSKVLDGSASANFPTLYQEFECIGSLSPFAPAVKLLCNSFKEHPRSNLVMKIAVFFQIMTNEQAEIFQIINIPEMQFLAEVLQRCDANCLSTVELKRHKEMLNVRASLVSLVQASLVKPASTGASSIGLTLNTDVRLMLSGIFDSAQRAFSRARQHVVLPPISAANRAQADPSTTGIAINFTQHGEMLREIPRFINVASEAGNKKKQGMCQKPQQLKTRHGKYLNRTQGVFNVVCLKSKVSMGVIIMHAAEGRSLGVSVIYSFLPRYRRTVVCDTGCQSANWAHTRLRRFFLKWRFLVDAFHHGKGKKGHKCGPVCSPSEFSEMNGKNDSFVEQLHAIQRFLGLTMQSTSMERAMFLIQLLNDDVYHKEADNCKLSPERRSWPDESTVEFAEDDSDDESAEESAVAGAEEVFADVQRGDEDSKEDLNSDAEDDLADDVEEDNSGEEDEQGEYEEI